MSSGRERLRRWRSEVRPASAVVGVITVTLAVVVGCFAASADSSVEGSQGTDTALPATASAMTVSASSVLGSTSPFAGLSITVNQTQQLANQAISVTWTGGTPTDSDLTNKGKFDDNYLQIFQCWTANAQTQPTPDKCEFGANELQNSYVQLSNALSTPIQRAIQSGDTSPFAYTSPDGISYMPFQPVDGTPAIDVPTVPSTDPNNPGNIWQNSYFDYTTTNEVDYARTYPDGTGSQLFTVDTGLEAPGLGCGQEISQPDGSNINPQCWLVVVPRGTPAQENGPNGQTGAGAAVDTSPLQSSAWKNHLAFPLGFNPVDTSCQLGQNEERVVGGEMAQDAVVNWSPALCSSPSNPPFQYSALSEDQARQELVTGSGSGGPVMAVVSQPIADDQAATVGPVTYAPLSLSGVVIGFNVDRQINLAVTNPTEAALIGKLVQNIYLTPRLVAKLLTQSYPDAFYGLNPENPPSGYSWLKHNAYSLLVDPDFLQFNPEFNLLRCAQPEDCSGLVVEQPTSDAAQVLWNWVLSDPEAKAWLAGTPDAWGMQVNPNYDTNSAQNPTGAGFAATVPNSFPKSDPYSYQDPTQLPSANNQLPRPLGMEDFLPYTTSLQAAASATRAANDGAKLNLNLGALSPDQAWSADGPQPIGSDFIMSITDSADAAQYGLQAANLSRSGDDGSSRVFIAPDTASFQAAESEMQTATGSSGLLETNVSPTSASAYPMTMLTYGAVFPSTLATADCAALSSFLNYAAGTGQTTGTAPGDLPPGYAPLPQSLLSQDQTAAQTIVSQCGVTPSTNDTTTTTTVPSTTSTTVASHGSTGSSTTTSAPAASNSTGSSGGSTTVTIPTVTATNGSSGGSGSAATSSTATSTTSTTTASPAGGGSPGSSGTTSPPTTAVSAPPGRTIGVKLAGIRWIIPMVIVIGLLSALIARWLDVWARQRGRVSR